MLDLDRDGFITKEEFIQVHISTFQMNYGGKISSSILIHYTSFLLLVSGVKDVG